MGNETATLNANFDSIYLPSSWLNTASGLCIYVYELLLYGSWVSLDRLSHCKRYMGDSLLYEQIIYKYVLVIKMPYIRGSNILAQRDDNARRPHFIMYNNMWALYTYLLLQFIIVYCFPWLNRLWFLSLYSYTHNGNCGNTKKGFFCLHQLFNTKINLAEQTCTFLDLLLEK